MIALMNSQHNGPINFGNPNEITIKELAKLIINKINPNLKINYHQLPEDDPLKRKPNINIAKKEIKWEPTVSLDKGLDKTIQYFQKYFNLT